MNVPSVFMGMVCPTRKMNRRPGNTDEGKPFLWDKMSHVACHELVSFISLLSVKNAALDFCAIIPSWLAKVPAFDSEPRSFLYRMSLGFVHVCGDSCCCASNPGYCYLSPNLALPISIRHSTNTLTQTWLNSELAIHGDFT